MYELASLFILMMFIGWTMLKSHDICTFTNECSNDLHECADLYKSSNDKVIVLNNFTQKVVFDIFVMKGVLTEMTFTCLNKTNMLYYDVKKSICSNAPHAFNANIKLVRYLFVGVLMCVIMFIDHQRRIYEEIDLDKTLNIMFLIRIFPIIILIGFAQYNIIFLRWNMLIDNDCFDAWNECQHILVVLYSLIIVTKYLTTVRKLIIY